MRLVKRTRRHSPATARERLENRCVAVGPTFHLCSLNIFSLMMVLPRVQVSCELLKHCGTTAGIVRVGYGWKRKCFFAAHWADAP
jgi:hypothetical protein